MEKVLTLGADGVKELTPIDASSGVADAGKVVGTDANGKVNISLIPDGIGSDTKVAPASEALLAGDFVNFWSDGGTLKVRKADASNAYTKAADGYVKANVAMNANATVYFDGTNTSLTGLTPLAKYYLSASTPGGVVSAAPTASGHIWQVLGKALSATELTVEIGEPILRA